MRKYGLQGIATGLLAAWLVVPFASVQAQDDPFGAGWPEGEGRALTGAWCGGCHSLNLVKQQGLTHEGWDVLLDWMSAKQNMPPLSGDNRSLVLGYLTSNFGIENSTAAMDPTSGSSLAPLSPVQGINHLPALEIRPVE
ncbi:hypothetical protein [Granulosicoccus antarcticus]|uniref:Cytochrome c domain-containing protein n=1 Tax=Granulosicoccus antarcticus IMCC3135 TaxID=1192854 RepID=A0A2Z2NSE3_9GAMM|nr:hypothetical protein [Granulosicoccus antarcticus]ASJ74199.1 hypothetical protein IMCC3135_20610 [Granulosicoccus antarcticus IMCC3135]